MRLLSYLLSAGVLLLEIPFQACQPDPWQSSLWQTWQDASGWRAEQHTTSLDVYGPSNQLQYRLEWQQVMPSAYQSKWEKGLKQMIRCFPHLPWIYHGLQAAPGAVYFKGQALTVRVLLAPSEDAMYLSRKTCGPYKELLFDRDTGNPLNTWETAEVINPCPQSAL